MCQTQKTLTLSDLAGNHVDSVGGVFEAGRAAFQRVLSSCGVAAAGGIKQERWKPKAVLLAPAALLLSAPEPSAVFPLSLAVGFGGGPAQLDATNVSTNPTRPTAFLKTLFICSS
jgi:hypothetical protein